MIRQERELYMLRMVYMLWSGLPTASQRLCEQASPASAPFQLTEELDLDWIVQRLWIERIQSEFIIRLSFVSGHLGVSLSSPPAS